MHRTRGFTVVELMVALAVAAVLFGLAVPAFNGFVAQRNITAQVNDFVLAVTLARSEATRRQAVVSVQALNAGDEGNEWGPGYCVTVGTPGGCGTPLRLFSDTGAHSMDANGAFDTLGTFSFNGRGTLTLGISGTIDLCHPSEDPGRRISLSAIGRVSTQELTCNP